MDAQTDDWDGIPISDAAAPKADDWGGIPIEETAKPSLAKDMQTPVTRGTLAVGSKAIEGFKEGFGDAPWGSWIKPEDAEKYPKTASAWKLAGFPVEAIGRTFSGGVNALGHAAAETYTQLGGNPDEGKRFGRDIAGMAESRMFDVGQHVPKPHTPPKGVHVPAEPPWEPSHALKEWLGPSIDGEWYSPATARPDLKVGNRETRLLPHDYVPEPDTGGRYGVGAAASPGGPLHDTLPETRAILREDLGEFTPGTLGQRLEDMSPHMPFAHISEQTRSAAGGLYSHPGAPKVEIYNTVSQLAKERPERLTTIADRAFGPAENTVETQKLLREERAQVAAPFWQRFRSTPIEPTQRLASLEPRLRKTGAWKYAEDQLGIEGASTTEKARFPEEEGSEAPTPAFYEVVRQGLNKKIAKLYSEAGDNGPEVARLVKLYNEVTDAIDAHPDQAVAGLWKEGREASGRYAKALEAMATGERLMTQNIHEYKLPEILERYDDWQKEYLVKGVRKWLGDQLGKKGTGLATINNVLTGPVRRKITQVIGQEKAEALFRDLEHERDMIDYEPDLIGNKRTGASAPGRKMQADRFAPPEGGVSDMLGKAGNFIRHPVRSMTSTALDAGQRALDTKAAAKWARVREELARVHTLQGPERDAVARHLIGDEPMGEPAPRAPRPSPADPGAAPARPPLNAVDATEVLRAHGFDQGTINRMGGDTRTATAKYLQEKYPNGPPPKPVAEFPADREVGVVRQPRPAPAAPEPPVASLKAEKPLSLLEWIRKQGGISPDDPLASDVRGMFGGKNPGGLIRKGGKRLDNLREGALEEKYFLDRGDITGGEAESTISTLLDAMVREVDGNKQYPLGSEVRQRRNRDMEAHDLEQRRELEFSPEARRMDRELAQYGVTRGMMPSGARERAIEMLRSGVETDAVDAFERAVSEQRQAEAQGEHAAEVGEGLEPSPQSAGVAPRGNPVAGEGQSGTGEDVRDTGTRNRAEKDTLARKTLAKRLVSIYNAPDRNVRSFSEDYKGASANDSQAGAALTHDVDNKPLTAPYIAGRRRVGGVDEPISPADYEAITKAATGRSTQYLKPSEMGGDAGQVELHPLTRRVDKVNIDKTLSPEKMAMVRAHELGHVVDQMAGEIPVTGLVGELQGIYNTLNNGNRAKGGLEAAAWGKPMTPKGMGYKGVQVAREYMAEAIRAYITNPNYLKTMAPRVAARIRQYVNSHPELMKIIQFNMLALGMLPWESIGKALPFAAGGRVK